MTSPKLKLASKTTSAVTLQRLTNTIDAFNEWLDDNSADTEIEDVALLYEGEQMMLITVYADDTSCQLFVTFANDTLSPNEPVEVETMTQYFDTIATVLLNR